MIAHILPNRKGIYMVLLPVPGEEFVGIILNPPSQGYSEWRRADRASVP